MPDMPQPAGPGGAPSAPPAAAPAGAAPGGPYVDAINQAGQLLAEAVQKAGGEPPKGVQAALMALSQALQEAQGGEDAADGGADDAQEQAGATTPEQGASGAQPMTHASMRGG